MLLTPSALSSECTVYHRWMFQFDIQDSAIDVICDVLKLNLDWHLSYINGCIYIYKYIYIYQRLWTLKILQIEAVICSNANSVASGPQVTYFSVFVPKYEITVSGKCIKRPSIKIDHFVPVLMYSIHNACRYKSDGTMYSSWLCLLWPSGHAEQTAAKFEWNYSNPYVINTWKCCDAHADHYGIGCCFLLKLEYYS